MTTKKDNKPDYKGLLIEAVTMEGELSQYYKMFYNYSIGNMFMAMSQLNARNLPINRIATFKAWDKLGRKVKKGQKAIRLSMPKTVKYDHKQKDGSIEERVFQSFITIPRWFSYDQTEGNEIGMEDITLPTWDKDKALTALEITEEAYNQPMQNAQGYAYANEDGKQFIAVSPTAQFPYKTRFHEIAHNVLGHTKERLESHGALHDTNLTTTSVKEVEAESVAYILLNLLGLDGAKQSRGYIQNWIGAEVHGSISDKSAQKIFSAVDKILKAGS